jgi:hypothetical protein
MKFQGQSLKAIVEGAVNIPRPDGTYLTFKIRATALGDEAKGERIFPNPRPPIDFVYDKKGLVVRDRNDKPLREPNTADSDYITRNERAFLMQAVVTCIDAISFEGSGIEWETTETKGTKAYYEAVFDELKSAGFGFGDIRLINQRLREISNLDSKTLEKAAESFSAQGEQSD